MKHTKKWLIGAGLGLAAAIGAVIAAGEVLSAPSRAVLGEPPADLHATAVTIAGASPALAVKGWLIRGEKGQGDKAPGAALEVCLELGHGLVSHIVKR